MENVYVIKIKSVKYWVNIWAVIFFDLQISIPLLSSLYIHEFSLHQFLMLIHTSGYIFYFWTIVF